MSASLCRRGDSHRRPSPPHSGPCSQPDLNQTCNAVAVRITRPAAK
jgi:hypothetical protein